MRMIKKFKLWCNVVPYLTTVVHMSIISSRLSCDLFLILSCIYVRTYHNILNNN